MSDQDLEESLRIARREHQLAVERHDDDSAAILERAIIDLESLERRIEQGHVVRLRDLPDLPRQQAPEGAARQSDEVS